ncbi:hypothetical protein E2C01_040599 [Portunus trituberculatus]|uniref:Uncharacterized protein n=1 Tax=Portunus trituberculatus TaxID=210409 RepID=A0A5B7FNN5_PORTR|nr:hypothetical protein [Portunus trituberculatus]
MKSSHRKLENRSKQGVPKFTTERPKEGRDWGGELREVHSLSCDVVPLRVRECYIGSAVSSFTPVGASRPQVGGSDSMRRYISLAAPLA